MERFVQDRFEQATAFRLCGGALRFQPVVQGHEFVYSGHDTMLFGYWWVH
jgi:hypothetical protein